jgi:uncharacterized membrane protein HdeD (DUF308 family)
MARSVRNIPAHNWAWFLVRGVLALALAVLILIFPAAALFSFTLVLAVYAFADGVASIVSGVRGASKGEHWGWLVFRGILGILVGVLFVLMPLLATFTYAFLGVLMLAFWCMLSGLGEISAAIRLRREIEGEWLLGLAGIFSLVLGVAIFALVLPSPAATILSATWLIMIYAWAAGIVLIAQALRLRRRAILLAPGEQDTAPAADNRPGRTIS